MLFVAEYELTWDTLEAAMAKRLEWDELRPKGFRYIGEYVWQDGDPAFRGVVIFEADGIDAINAFTLQYGPSLTMKIHPADDVVSAIASLQRSPREEPKPAVRKRRR